MSRSGPRGDAIGHCGVCYSREAISVCWKTRLGLRAGIFRVFGVGYKSKASSFIAQL